MDVSEQYALEKVDVYIPREIPVKVYNPSTKSFDEVRISGRELEGRYANILSKPVVEE